MNLTPSGMNDQVITQQAPAVYEPQQTCLMQNQWVDNNGYAPYQLPLQLSQYYNVFPDLPSTKTSWTFPNGCVTSNIVRFTGLPTPTYPVGSTMQSNQYTSCSTIPMKRKSLISESEEQPNKIFITEEKMAARMSGMHISNEFVSYTKPAIEEVDINEMDEELPQAVADGSESRLVICDELKQMSRQLDSIIPEPLVPSEKRSTALVIWRPPASYVDVEEPDDEDYVSTSSVVITDITDRPDLDNNNILTVDLNTLTLPPNVEYPAESMDAMEL